MDLEFSEEQKVLRDMVRSLCAAACPIETVRALEDDPHGVPEELWKQLGELGLLGVVIPEALGGSGQGLLDAVILHEELGRVLAPTPAFESAILCAGALLAAGSEEQQRHWLPKISSGEAILTPAWLEPRGSFGSRGIRVRAERSADGWTLQGDKRLVTFARAADRLLTLARTGPGEHEIGLFLVDPSDPGVTLNQTRSLASDTQYDVQLAGAPAEALGQATTGAFATWEEVMLDGVTVAAARANGGCDRALEMTVQYAKDRKQFDKPLGAFQAIAHYLADALTRLDGSRTLTYEAAWMRSQGRDVRKLAPMAKLFACQTFRDVTATCQQVWGGVGFAIEYDIQLYFRRAKQLQMSWLDGRHLEERIAAAILD